MRQALQEAIAGDIIMFDSGVFPSTNPTTIELTSGLPAIEQGNLTIDASNAGVVLDGSKITDRCEARIETALAASKALATGDGLDFVRRTLPATVAYENFLKKEAFAGLALGGFGVLRFRRWSPSVRR